jgi:hypothetical protein
VDRYEGESYDGQWVDSVAHGHWTGHDEVYVVVMGIATTYEGGSYAMGLGGGQDA